MNSRFILTAGLPFFGLLLAALVILYVVRASNLPVAPTVTPVAIIPSSGPTRLAAAKLAGSVQPPSPPAPVPDPPPTVKLAPASHTAKSVEMVFADMDLMVLSVPSDQRDVLMSVLQGSSVSNLSEVLGKFSGKVDFSTGTSLGARRGEAIKTELAVSGTDTLTYSAEPTDSHQILLEGDFKGVHFTKLFDTDSYQLVLATGDQPSLLGAVATNFQAVVVRLHRVVTANVAAHTKVISIVVDKPPAPAPPVPPPPMNWPRSWPGGFPSPPPTPVEDQPTPAPPPPAAPGPGSLLYRNLGDNVKDFVQKYGEVALVADRGTLMGSMGNGWMELPVTVTGDFKIEFDAYGDANDVGFFTTLFDEATTKGIDVENCPQGTVTSTISISSIADLTNTGQFLFCYMPLANKGSTQFPNRAWTHIVITKKGNSLTDDVGGQVITASLPKEGMPAEIHLGLGFYASTNVGGNGKARFANIQVVQTEARRKHSREQ